MRKLIVFLILLVVLLVVLDRVAVAGVQSEIARQVAARYDLDAEPEVRIDGIPFLTQAISGRYDEIQVDMGPMSLEGIQLAGVHATLYGVSAPLSDLIQNSAQAQITAERVTGAVVVPLETIERRAPEGVNLEGDGDGLKVSGEISVRGVRVPVEAGVRIEVLDGGVRLTPRNVTLAGGIPVPAETTRSLTYTIPIENLPLDLKLTEVKNTPEGLQVTGEATDVPLRG
ncbi:hypothetical protein Misp01_54740 [Microtetraspora sp. NBRC 13810]|uniref:LmeA family phospholipid-binding protein n=1 Tax=Microtetraspora sp. NBRC 13810 TaxID=3030990 RepID=UPI00249FC9B7|nr:DUF2993 domain-containing protein [Microtetraspora sp. NBRC 13810]GLW10346.1 hypothetical protein Misp01_54740 [Microtetraspora sp. NBRC 13810]